MLVQVTVSPALTAGLAGEKPDEVTATAVTPVGPLVAPSATSGNIAATKKTLRIPLAPRYECRTILGPND